LCFEIIETTVIANLHMATSLTGSLRNMGYRHTQANGGYPLE
jgi:EAL domain-containing protein (putative c-di-GMP-specific phosphodiesterase class I)